MNRTSAGGSYHLRNVSGQITEDSVPHFVGINSSYQSDADHLECVERFQPDSTIKRLSLKRRPRAAVNNVEKTQSGTSSGQWQSAESLSSSGSDDTRLLGMSSTARGRPPLPPPHGSSMESKAPAGSHTFTESKPQPAARSHARQGPVVEKPTVETHRHPGQEGGNQLPPQPHPRRRLASFGGVSSTGSLSPFTGLGAFNHNNNGNKPAGAGELSSSVGTRGSTGSLKLSPHSSGRTTPVASLGSMHLQHVRDQMVVALQRLKELEEQVKTIPILQVKISVLQEEKRLLVSQLKNQSDNDDMNDVAERRECSMERSDFWNKMEAEDVMRGDGGDLEEFRQLTEEMDALERTIKGRHLQAWHETGRGPLQDEAARSVTADKETDIRTKPSKENKGVFTDPVEMRSVGTEVSEVNLGIYTERDAELDAQQLIIDALKERICHLEAELKDSALQTELSRLKLELQAAGSRNRSDKATLAKPSSVSTGTEVRPHTNTQGVGNHSELRDACTGEAREVESVGVSCCGPELRDVCIGPDVPISHWEVRKRVETLEKGVGIHVFTNTRGVGREIKLCDAETNTDVPEENPGSQRGVIKHKSVACGDCSVDVIIRESKEVVSRGTVTDHVRGVDLGVMASPQTASQRTNTVSSSVSRFTSTRHAFNTDSCTNTVLSTRDKHTNTTQTVTRTVSVGGSAKETCSIGVGTANQPGGVTKVTRDTGVGFTNINDNFLVGLKTRNMASGPSHLPDPVKTRSVGVGEGRIRDLTSSSDNPGRTFQPPSQSQWDPELNHYIEKMQKLLGENGDLLSDDRNRGSAKPPCSSKAADGRPLDAQPPVRRDLQLPPQRSVEPPACEANDSEVKRMIQMLEQQASSALQERSSKAAAPRSVLKKQNGDQGCSSSRKSMKFLRVTAGLDPVSCYEPPACEKASAEEAERRGNKKSREPPPDGTQVRKKSGSSKGSRGSARSQARCKLSERMFSACQTLKTHLSDGAALTGREMHDCLQTLQQEWFSTSSHKSASPDAVESYLSTFRVVSPSVLKHVVNMADGNGNTALHYSVSHSNFGIVKKLLNAEVCNVDQQNKAGYTPVMLAALAAVRSPEDMRVVEQLFANGDVNAKASQAGQTALMLAVSHGRTDMVRALLARRAEVNLQDDEGSTALMCASEHGHAAIVRLLLAQPDCDPALTDSDGSTALSIALEAGHNDIAVLLYAHANFRGQTGAAAHLGGKSVSSSGTRNTFD